MWKWSCPKSPTIEWEHHSWRQLDEMLTAHENGIKVPGFREFPGCEEIHDYWDDGEPCRNRNCNIPYIRESSTERR